MTTAATTERPTTTAADRYVKHELIGSGASATVWRATRKLADGTAQPCALKILHPQHLTCPDVLDRFRREARIALDLAHPNIVRVYDFDSTPDGLAIVLELVDGTSLAAASLTLPQLAQAFRESLQALAYLHERGILHRDLSSGNLLITRNHHVKLTDFGLCKVTGDPATELSVAKGTAPYASPEALAGLELDETSDLYSLAAVFYEALTGAPPYGYGRTPVIRAAQQARAIAPLPPSVPADLRTVLHALLQPRPRRGYRSAIQVLRAIEAGFLLRPPNPLFRPLLLSVLLLFSLFSASLHFPPDAPATADDEAVWFYDSWR